MKIQKKNINNFGCVVEDKKEIVGKLEEDNKIKYQNYFSNTNENEKNKTINEDKNPNKNNRTKRKVNPHNYSTNHLLKEINNNNLIVENLQKINDSYINDKKTEVINKEKDNSNENVFSIMRGNLSKIQHQKNSILINDLKLKSLKYLSYFSFIDFLKSLIFKKEKESHNFISLFRKHLLSEEHLFKSHIKILFLEKQHNFSGEENINALECFNEV